MHATKVTNSAISLAWSQPDVEGNNNSSETTTTSAATTTDASKTNGKSTDDENAKAAKEFATEIGGAAAAADDDDIDFIVQYGKVNDMTMYEIVAKLENVSTHNAQHVDIHTIVT